MDPSSILLTTDQESPHLNTRGIFKNGTSFYCFICQKSEKDARKCLTHVLKISHCQAIEKVITSCVEIHGNFGCKLCTDYVASSWKEFLVHFNESGHSTKFTQDEQLQITRISNRTLVNNQIIELKPVTFFCYCCKETIIGGNSVQMHVEEKKHKEFQKNRMGTDSPINLRESECRKWARNFIFNLRRLYFYCILCDCSLPGQTITKQHIHTEDHVQYMLAKNNIIHHSLHKETVGIKNAQKKSSDHAVRDDIITGPYNIIFTTDQISRNLNARGIFKDDVSFNCLICNSAVKNLHTCLKHILAKAHCEKIEKIITSCVEIDGNLNCKFCTNYIASSWKQFLVHFNESNHSTKFTENDELQKSLVSNLTLVNNQIIEQKPGKFFCYCCKETMVGASSVHMHIKEEKHREFQKNRMEMYPPVKFMEGECRKWAKSFIINLYRLDFYCILCDHSLTEIRNTNQHIRSPNHVKCMFVAVDSIYQSLQTETVSGKNAQKESFLHATCDNTIAVPSGTSQFKQELFECKHSSSQVVSEYLSGQHHKNLIAIEENMNSSPKGDVSADDLSRPIVVEEPKQVIKKKVLRKTINPRYFNSDMQHIYDMNQEKLRMIKLSSQLCFPKALNAIYCLICQNSVPSQVQTFYEHIRSSSHVGYLAQMERDNQHFINYTEQWSDLMLSKEFLQEISDDTVQCFACDISLKNDDAVILLHVQKASHNYQKQLWNKAMDQFLHDILKQTESTWYNIQFYWCQSCDIQFKTEFFFTEHIDNKNHQKALKKKSSVRKRLVYDTCIPCAALWLGFPEFYDQHCKHPLHKALVRSGDYSRCVLPNQAKALLKNHKVEVSSLIESSNQVLTGQKVEVNSLLKCLENTIRPLFSDANAYPFGSRVSGLGFPDSDIDVFLDCSTYNGNRNCEDEAYQKHLISTVEQCLYDSTELWEIRETLVSSRTPIIKLHHRPTALSCDVSFKNGLSVENTKLLKCFIKNYPLCRELMLFLKKWLYVCNLSGSRSITNYALCWYVIFYLQVEEILPSIASLIAKENRSKIIDNWETGICEKFEVDGKRRTFTELLNGFFIFYTDFDFYNSVACPLLGKTMLKKDFLKLHLLPKEMTPYIEHVTANNYDDSVVFKIDSEMCIQDPYDLSHNLTKAVHKFTLNRFKRLCAVSADTVKGVGQH
ncbi:uncharacterized protein LOC107220223 [Neodiprion lecontei]|uniref:Uncharacterized protein LOC107220223 n=1 Tax=Neodiprion lecontei TaxID=441921 RepID=A0A6J0BHE4_NEOLC|nr:uncharacterized protein LOC107220223 [Neodiprion lecontei]